MVLFVQILCKIRLLLLFKFFKKAFSASFLFFLASEKSCTYFRTKIEHFGKIAIFQMIRMEANVKEWAELRPQTSFSSVMLSGANILVEFIKLVLFIVSFALDFIKPFTGTRFTFYVFFFFLRKIYYGPDDSCLLSFRFLVLSCQTDLNSL